MPVAKTVCRPTSVVHEAFALNETIASNNRDVLESIIGADNYACLDDCIDEMFDCDTECYQIRSLLKGPPKKKQKSLDLKPIAFVLLATREKGKPKPILVKALLDSGASGTLIAQKHVTKLNTKSYASKTTWSTPAGSVNTTAEVDVHFSLSELHDNRGIKWKAHVADSLGAYDMIIGRDLLTDLNIDLLFSEQVIQWDGHTLPFRGHEATPETSFHVQDSMAVDEASERIKGILDAKYVAADLKEVVAAAEHLTEEQQQMLLEVLTKHEELFDGTLGNWKDVQYDIELRQGAEPYHARAFPIPRIHTQTLKNEVERLCRLGVLKKVNRSEWAAPTFIIPKKDGTVRFISDFRELNKRIKRKPFPMPKIQDMLVNLEGFQYASSLDLNMGYYHIELTPNSKSYCTIVLPFGKYEYQRLPMGLCNSPDIFQEKMSELMSDLEFVRVYIDDLLTLTKGTFEDHLEKLDEVLRRVKDAGLKVNAKKSFFGRQELEYLGYWVTREGIQPLKSKVKAIHQIAPPKTKKQLRGFIGLINYYRDMWKHRSGILAPLAALTSVNAKWQWRQDVEQKAFDEIKKLVARETLLTFPDFNKPFEVHTDASHLALGAVISQENKPIAFYSRKLLPAQTRYTTTERELLSIVETLKEFRNILLGHEIIVHTDHKNLTYKNFNTERVMRWRLVLEEFGLELRYIKGEANVVADALSRLEMKDGIQVANALCNLEMYAADEFDEQFASLSNAELYVDLEEDAYPLGFAVVAEEQAKDADLQKQWENSPLLHKKKFPITNGEVELIVRDDKVVVPKTLQERAVAWYHDILLHPGEKRTELTISQHFYWKNLKETVARVCRRCPTCQLTKPKSVRYGKLPPKSDIEHVPWHTLCMDLIGPYEFGQPEKKNKQGRVTRKSTLTTLHCLVMLDPATGWFEIAEIDDKRADTISNVLQMTWFNRYPWPTKIINDRGTEFMAEVKELVERDIGVKQSFITTRNPQANANCERVNKIIHNMIRSFQIRDVRDLDVKLQWQGVLSSIGFAIRSTVHTTTQATAAQLVFHRDAIHNVAFKADWKYIYERKQRLIQQNNARENRTRRAHTYAVGDRVLVANKPAKKHGTDHYKGPFTVTQVYNNGTVRLEQSTPSGGVVSQTWNIRNVTPYHD